MSYIQIDPCVPAVVPSPGSNGGISLDCVSTKTVTSTVTQTVQARYIDAVSIQANQVSCTDLIVGGQDISTNTQHITSDATSTLIDSSLYVDGDTTLQGVHTLGNAQVSGNETVEGYLVVQGNGSQFQGSCYFGNGLYYGSAPLYPRLTLLNESLIGKSEIVSLSIPSWAQSICISFTNLTTTANNGGRIQIGNSDGWYTSLGCTGGNKGAESKEWLPTTQGVWLINAGWSYTYMITGCLLINKVNDNLYSVTGTGNFVNTGYWVSYSGQMYGTGVVDRIRLYVETSGTFKDPGSLYPAYVNVTVS